MELSNAVLLPGVVVDAEDPKCLGRVKCITAGLTNPDTMDTNCLPWYAPLTCFGYQRISKPVEGQKVWILHDKSNYYEYYYLPAWDVNSNTELISPNPDYDVLVSRSGEGYGAQMFYNSEEGFVTRIGNDISTTIKKDKSIINTDNVVEMSIRDKHVYCGLKDSENYEPMVRGEQLVKLLGDLKTALSNAADLAKPNMYTSHLGDPLKMCSTAIEQTLNEICSQNAKVSE